MAEMKDRWMGRHTMPTIVLDAKTYKDRQKLGMPNPFMDQQIIICSMHFAASRIGTLMGDDEKETK